MEFETPHVMVIAQAESPAVIVVTPAEEAHEEAPGAADASQDHEVGELHATTEAHGEAHSDVFPPFDPNTFGSQLIWLAITFAILYVALSRVALPRIGGIIEDRKTRIDADLATAEASRQRTDAAIAAYEAALAAARSKAQAMAEETRTGIKTDIDARRAAVEADLSRRMSEAEARIQATKAEALGHVGEIAADTVAAVVGPITGPVEPAEARAAVAAVNRETV